MVIHSAVVDRALPLIANKLKEKQVEIRCDELSFGVIKDYPYLAKASDEDFYTEAHKNIFDGMSTLLKRNQPIDLVTLSDIMEKNGVLDASGGIDYIASLVDIMPSSANFRKYFDIVKRESLLRRLIKGSASVIEECRQSTDGETSLAFAEKNRV